MSHDGGLLSRGPHSTLQVGERAPENMVSVHVGAEGLLIKAWTSPDRLIPFSDLLVHDCSLAEVRYEFTDWLSDFLTHPLLSLASVFAIGRTHRRLRLEVSHRRVGRPAVALLAVSDDVGPGHVAGLSAFLRMLAATPALCDGLALPDAPGKVNTALAHYPDDVFAGLVVEALIPE